MAVLQQGGPGASRVSAAVNPAGISGARAPAMANLAEDNQIRQREAKLAELQRVIAQQGGTLSPMYSALKNQETNLRREIQELSAQRDSGAAERAETAANAAGGPAIQYQDYLGLDAPSDELFFGRSAVEDVQGDPRAIAAQQAALDQLSQWGQGGVTAADRAMYGAEAMQNRQASDQMARSQREALLQNMSARGLGGSNAELAAMLGSSQAQVGRYATQDAQNRANMLGQIQNRALSAISGQGALGGQVRQQSFNEGAQRAGARDNFNANNIGFRQQLYGEDQDRKQNAYTGNVGTYNTAVQNQFGNQSQVAGNLANVHTGYAASDDQRRREEQQRQANQTAGYTQLGYGLGSALDQRRREELSR